VPAQKKKQYKDYSIDHQQ